MKYIQSCHWLKKCKSQTIVKLSNRNDSLEILPKKKQLCNIEPAVLDLPQDTKFLSRNVYAPTQGIWNKFLKNILFIVLHNHWHKACLGWGKWLPYVFYTYGWLGTIVSGGPHWKFLRHDIKLWTCSFICSKVSKLFPATSLWNSHVLFLHLHPYFSPQFEIVSFVFEIDHVISSNFFRWSFALWNETSMVIYSESLNQPCGSLPIFYNKRFACIIWDKVILKSYWIKRNTRVRAYGPYRPWYLNDY